MKRKQLSLGVYSIQFPSHCNKEITVLQFEEIQNKLGSFAVSVGGIKRNRLSAFEEIQKEPEGSF